MWADKECREYGRTDFAAGAPSVNVEGEIMSDENPMSMSERDEPSMGEPSMGEPSMGEPSMGEPSMGEPSMGEPSMGEGDEPSMGHPDEHG
jgi:hypothetical protein